MTIFDLLLILVVLASAASFIGALIQAVTGNLRGSFHTLRALVCGIGIYLALVCMVSLTSKQKVLELSTPNCNDDWCMMPSEARDDHGLVTIKFKVWSRARRVAQREFGVKPFLLDESGRRYDASASSGPPFDQRLQPDETFTTVRTYQVDPSARNLDLVLRDGFGPETFVIGSSQSLLHKRTVYRIKPAL